MQKYTNTVLDSTGAPLAQAAVLIQVNPAGATATVYSDNGVSPVSNPLTTDTSGVFKFYAADGRYDATISKTGYTTTQITDIILNDPVDADAGTTAFSLTVLNKTTANAWLTTLTATRAETGSVAVPVLNKLREVISVKDFGAVGDGVTDDTTAFSNAISAADAANAALHVPGGALDYVLTAKITKTLVNTMRLFGDGSGASVLRWTAGTGGFDFTYSTLTEAPKIEGMSLTTSQSGGGVALKITSPVSASTTTTGAILRDVKVRGSAPATTHWTGGIYLLNCWYPLLDMISIKGRDETALPFSMSYGITLDVCQAVWIRSLMVAHVEDSVLQAGVTFGEGLNASVFEFVGVRRGFKLQNSVAIIGITNGHINAYEGGLVLSSTQQGAYTGLSIYKTNISTSNFIGISLTGCRHSNIQANHIEDGTGATGTMTSIQMTTTNDAIVSGNTFDNYQAAGSGIVIGSSSANNIVLGNIGGTLGADVNTVVTNSDAGANNVIAGNSSNTGVAVTISNSPAVVQYVFNNYPLSGGQVLTANSATPSVGNAAHERFQTANTGATTITDFTGSFLGQVITVLCNDANTTIQHNSGMSLQGGVNFVAGNGAIITLLRFTASIWRETSRRTA